MNAKSFLLGLILSVLMPISLYADKVGWVEIGDRSFFDAPHLYIENNKLYIASEFQLENISIQIKDLSGGILYSTVTTILPGTNFPVSLDNITTGNYLIELRQGDNYLVGYFTK